MRAKVLKEQQEQKRQLEEMKKQKLDLIQKIIEEVNREFETDLKISEFNFLIDKVLDEIPKTIRARANYIYQERKAEEQIKLSEILKLTPKKALFGNRRAKTHWLIFMKEE